jgi:hypothetical protein
LLLFSPHDDARNCGLLSSIPLFISAAAVVLLGFLQNWACKKRKGRNTLSRGVFFACLSVYCKWPLFLGILCFVSIGLWLASMSGDTLICWNIK